MGAYFSGNTIRLSCIFENFQEEKVDPVLIKLIIYNYKYQKLHEYVLDNNNRSALGEYFFDYVSQSQNEQVFYEWYGEIDGTPSIARGSFSTKFI